MSEPIRVLNMFTIMNRGGAETMVMNYYRNIDRSKVQFDFLVHRQERGAYDDEIEALGGRIYRMPSIKPQNFSSYKKELKSFFEKHQEYKIIHSHMSELGYFAFKEAKKQEIPIRICHAHNAPHSFNAKMIMRNYFKYAMKSYITHMFTCGKEAGEWLYGKNNTNKFIQMNNAIDTNLFVYNEEVRNTMRKELNIEDSFVVGHVGRFHRQKNHDRLVKIFYEITKIKNNAILMLVGAGEFSDQTKKFISDHNIKNIICLGTRGDVNKVCQAFDIFLFPSLYEGLPVSVIEMQASGLQCFIADTISKQTIVTENVTMFSLDTDDKTIAKMIVSSHENFSRKNVSKDIEKAGFDIEKNAKWLEEFYINEYNKYNK